MENPLTGEPFEYAVKGDVATLADSRSASAADVHHSHPQVSARVPFARPCPHAYSSSAHRSAPATSAPPRPSSWPCAKPRRTRRSRTSTSSPSPTRRSASSTARRTSTWSTRPRTSSATSTTTWTSPRRADSKRDKLRLLVEQLNLRKLCDLLECERWDVIVNTHFMPAEIIASMRKKREAPHAADDGDDRLRDAPAVGQPAVRPLHDRDRRRGGVPAPLGRAGGGHQRHRHPDPPGLRQAEAARRVR